MELKIKRALKEQKFTIGKLYIDGKYFCDTLEDRDRGLVQSQPLSEISRAKVYGETAIPAGKYALNMDTVSPKFRLRSWAAPYNGIVPRIMDVPGFEGVLIHPGNKPEDTLGCILVGINKGYGQVLESTMVFHNLMRFLVKAHEKGELIHIVIE